MLPKLSWVLATLLLAAPNLAAQPPQAIPTYDVVAIKPNLSGSGHVSIDVDDNYYTALNVSLKTLLQDAFGIREDLISGISGPLASARFDITAKIVDPNLPALRALSQADRGAMLIPMLTERFQLKAHREIKTLPMYELVTLPTGPKFRPTVNPSPQGGGTHIRNRELTATNLPIASFTNTLSYQVNRTVMDKTGLTARYDFSLKWSREDDPDPQPDAPSNLFTALQEQLGLKLRPARGPVDTLVIDHVEMPSEN